jgi:hypothetical protein
MSAPHGFTWQEQRTTTFVFSYPGSLDIVAYSVYCCELSPTAELGEIEKEVILYWAKAEAWIAMIETIRAKQLRMALPQFFMGFSDLA